jgi:N-acetylmuramic acid 6-phosphate etherase
MAYAGAGSSGMIAQMDALELPGTYGIPADRFPVLLAGGPEALLALPSEAEDDRAAAEAAVDACGIGPADGFIAIAASGRTPFTVAALRRAKARGAVTIGIACVPDSPLLEGSDHAILMETPPEVVAGSTRMGAGTAQKCALNILSTGVAVRLGHAYAGLMVNMSPDNAKLKARAVAIVAQAAGAEPEQARAALDEADWSIKTAVVLSVAGIDAAEARVRLARQDGNIRAALTGE